MLAIIQVRKTSQNVLVLYQKDQSLKFMGVVETVKMLKAWACLTAAWFLILSMVTPAVAHPHMWVDLESRVMLHNDGRSIAIQQIWLFDDFFSTAVIEDAAVHPEGKNIGIQQEIDRILVALEPYNYFTVIKHGNETLSSKLVGDVEWKVIQNRIQMKFSLAVDKHNGLETKYWSYAIFDPTYYIEMLHAEGATITIEGEASTKCNSWIEQPNPSSDAVALSQSTTLDNNPNETIGRLFAETVHVNC